MHNGDPKRSDDPFDDLVFGEYGPVRPRPVGPGIYRRRRLAALAVIAVAVVVAVILVAVFLRPDGDSGGDRDASVPGTTPGTVTDSAGPLPGVPVVPSVGALPPGGNVTSQGRGTWQEVGSAGATAGRPDAAGTRTVSYVVEVEQGLSTASFGGGDSFSAIVDATLADPRSWIGNRDDRIAFRHVGGTVPDLRVRLTTPETTRRLCGSEIRLETSCFLGGGDGSGDSRSGWVVINVARWVRGAVTFAGDLGSYRQYVLNHEIGHGIGHRSHQPCPAAGTLAPVMMQQTLSLSNRDLTALDTGEDYRGAPADAVCVANAWPHPEG